MNESPTFVGRTRNRRTRIAQSRSHHEIYSVICLCGELETIVGRVFNPTYEHSRSGLIGKSPANNEKAFADRVFALTSGRRAWNPDHHQPTISGAKRCFRKDFDVALPELKLEDMAYIKFFEGVSP